MKLHRDLKVTQKTAWLAMREVEVEGQVLGRSIEGRMKGAAPSPGRRIVIDGLARPGGGGRQT